MKVCLISSENIETPPTGYWGGIEAVVWDLATALDQLGHQVSLIGRRGSQAPPRGTLLETFGDEPDPKHPEWGTIERHYDAYKDFVKSFDGVVHDHSNGHLSRLIHDRSLHTVHWMQDPRAVGLNRMVAVSHAQAKWLNEHAPSFRRIPVVHHGIDLSRFTYKEEKEPFYLYFSVVAVYKGAAHALRLAKETGKPFVFAGRSGDMTGEINRRDLPNLIYLGEVSNEERRNLFSCAKALVFPTGAFGECSPPWLEVFGLVMLEALASGTPVIASSNGACPEVIEDGEVGFICNTYAEMKQIIEDDAVESIRPQKCRRYCEERFSAERMAKNYLELYRMTLSDKLW